MEIGKCQHCHETPASATVVDSSDINDECDLAYQVQCTCGMSGPVKWDLRDAISAWNAITLKKEFRVTK